MRYMKLTFILLYYVILVLPTLAQNVNNNIADKISSELIRHYKDVKFNLLRKNSMGDYKFYQNYIENEGRLLYKFRTIQPWDEPEPIDELLEVGYDYLYKMNMIVPGTAGDEVVKGLRTVQNYLEDEYQTTDQIFAVFTIRRGDHSFHYDPNFVKKIENIKEDVEEVDIDQLSIYANDIDIIDRNVIIDAYKSSRLTGLQISSCLNGVYQMEGELLNINDILGDIRNKCGDQKVNAVNIFAFGELFLNGKISTSLAKHITILAPKQTDRGVNKLDYGTDGYIVSLSMEQNLNPDKLKTIITDNGNSLLLAKSGSDPFNEQEKKELLEHFLPILNEYKSKLIQSFHYMNIESKIDFLNSINSYKLLNQFSDSMVIYNDVYNLVKGNIKLTRKNPNFRRIYISMLTRITDKAESLPPNYSEEKKLLIYLYAAVQSKLLTVEENEDKTFVVKMDKQIKNVQNRVQQIKQNNHIQAIKAMNKEYGKSITDKIQEGQSFINDNISPKITELQNTLITNVQKLLKDIDDKKVEIKQAIKDLENQRLQSIFKGLLSVLSGICMIIGGPIGIAVGAGLAVGSAVVGSLDLAPKPVAFPPDLEDNMNKLDVFISNYDEKTGSIIDKMSEKLKTEDDPVFSGTKAALSFSKASKGIGDALTPINVEINENIQKLSKSTKAVDMKNLKTFKTLRTTATVGIAVAATATEVASTTAEVLSINEQIDEKNKQLEHLDKLSDMISGKLIPFLKKIQVKLEKDKENLKTGRPITLSIKQFQIAELLGGVRSQLAAVSAGFKSAQKINEVAAKLDKYFEFLIDIYQKIQKYEEHKQFADYLTKIQNPNIKLQNDQHEDARLQLDSFIKKEIVVKEYKELIESVEQYAFPYYGLFLENVEQHNIDDSETSTEDVINNVESNLITLANNFDQADANVGSADSNTQDDYFNITTKPYFEWKYNPDNEIAFRNLFKGKKVLFTAVQPETLNNNIIKLKTVNVLIKSSQPQQNANLANKLKDYRVNIKHLGDSHYKCDDKDYFIPSTSTVTFNCEIGTNPMTCDRCCTNADKKVMNSGYPRLSPYATFSIQLVPIVNSGAPSDIGLPRIFNRKLSMYLEGYGQYSLSTENNLCNQPQYYNDFKLKL